MLSAEHFVSNHQPIHVNVMPEGGALGDARGSILFIPGGMLFRCPSGSGEVGHVMFGPMHHWNGSVERPTITGCIQRGNWLGHLRNGQWQKALH